MSKSYTVDELAGIAMSTVTYGAAVKEYLTTTGLYESVPVGGNKNVHQWRTAPNRAPQRLSNFKKLFACISTHNSSVFNSMPLVSPCMPCMHACPVVLRCIYRAAH